MNFLKETKQHYFCVMIIEFIFLSCIYWLFFSFGFSSFLAYLVFLSFYITGYRFWINILNKKENLLLCPSEHFTIINFIIFLVILALNSLSGNGFHNGMFFVYTTILVIYVLYYVYRLQKQKKSTVPYSKISPTLKVAIILGCIFLLFDFFVYRAGKLNIQLILYLPFLFLILTALLFIYKKVFEFKSFFAAILFFNIYISATTLLALNCFSQNFFFLTIFFHFIIFVSVIYLLVANSTLSKEQSFIHNREFIYLLFANAILIFIFLNNIFGFIFPEIFVSYNYFIAILFITYIILYSYKSYLNKGLSS